jgi:hypothetical protein
MVNVALASSVAGPSRISSSLPFPWKYGVSHDDSVIVDRDLKMVALRCPKKLAHSQKTILLTSQEGATDTLMVW